MPTNPLNAAGMRVDPPPSLAVQNGTRPAATAAAEPPLDPPGVRSRFHGLRVVPHALVLVNAVTPNSGAAVFPTGTKSNIAGLLGLKGLARLRRATALPMVAIAGINADNAAAVIATDVDGIAVVSAIVAAEDPKAAAARLKSVIATARKGVRLPAQR